MYSWTFTTFLTVLFGLTSAGSDCSGSCCCASTCESSLMRRAYTVPSQPLRGQGPRHVTRPFGAFVVTTRPHLGQVPRTFSGSAISPHLFPQGTVSIANDSTEGCSHGPTGKTGEAGPCCP